MTLAAVPEDHRDAARAGLDAAFGSGAVSSVTPVGGGASGALTYRVDVGAGPHFLRVETLRGPMRNPHQYECLRIAAEAGIAPPIRFLDEHTGVLIIPFVQERPLADHPGGPAGVATAGATLLRRLHDAPQFPAHGDHFENLTMLLRHLATSGGVAPKLLDRQIEGLERLRSAYPWRPDEHRSAHNDPNPANLLYDGERLWLIDWETASRNDPFVDLATMAAHLAPTPDLRATFLETWLGRAPEPLDEARLSLMGLAVQLWVGAMLLMLAPDPTNPVHTDLSAPSLDGFMAGFADGTYVPGEPATTVTFAKVMLRAFADGKDEPQTTAVLAIPAAG
jgi:hypothetical protein